MTEKTLITSIQRALTALDDDVQGGRDILHNALERAACGECARIDDGFGPSHDASPRCKSGGYDHCTCDTCF